MIILVTALLIGKDAPKDSFYLAVLEFFLEIEIVVFLFNALP
jgi:hypothetical protein